jgi:hypothetical protein
MTLLSAQSAGGQVWHDPAVGLICLDDELIGCESADLAANTTENAKISTRSDRGTRFASMHGIHA